MKDRQQTRPSYRRRIVIASALLCGAFLALLAAIVVIAPKVINSGEVRSRIEAVIARELNGTFTYESAELTLLPRPDVVLHKVKVDLPGTLTASIAAVRIHARLLPLFRGRFAVSSISLGHPELALTLKDTAAGRKTGLPAGVRSSGKSFETALAVTGRELPGLSFRFTRGKISLLREGRLFMTIDNLEASLAFAPPDRDEGGADPSAAGYHITGTARATVSGTEALPSPLTISEARFDAIPGAFSFKDTRAILQDLTATVSGDLKGYLTSSPRSSVQARGTIGPSSLAWLQSLAGMPEGLSLRAPLTVSSARLRTSGTGSAAERTITVNAQQKSGVTIALEMHLKPGSLSIDNLHVQDNESDAVVKFSSDHREDAASFAGNLSGATIDRILERGRTTPGWIMGDLQVRIPRGMWDGAAVSGSLEGGQLDLPALSGTPFAVVQFAVLADGATVALGPATLSIGRDVLQISGTGSLAEGGIELDLDAETDRISSSTIRALAEWKPKERTPAQGPQMERTPKMSGSIRLRAVAVVADRYQADDVDLHLDFEKGKATAVLDRASVCGISFTGSLRAAGSEVEVSLSPQARGRKLAESLPCVFLKDLGVSGSFDLTAQLAGRGTWDTLLRSMGGDFSFTASGGRFQNDQIVKGVIAYLNSTSLLKGSNDKLVMEGVPYETFVLRGTLKDGTISLSEGVIRGRDLHLAAEGNIDLRKSTLALKVLAAPFTRLDRMLGSVPLVKSLVGNALIVVPARIAGTFEHPSVKPLAASGVSKNVTNLMKNAVHAPMKIIDPGMPKEPEGKDKQLPQ